MEITRDRSPYYAEFIEFITSEPDLDAMANFRLSAESEARISRLLAANREGTLNEDDEGELDDYLRLEHIMRLMKYRAYEKLADK
jgi:hypothetical protein